MVLDALVLSPKSSRTTALAVTAEGVQCSCLSLLRSDGKSTPG